MASNNTPDNVLRWVRGEAPADIDIVEVEREASDGTKYTQRLYRDTIKRKLDGALKEVRVCLRCPTTSDRTRATMQALAWAQREADAVGFDIRITSRDIAVGLLGRERFEEKYLKALLALCVHDPDGMHAQYLLPDAFDLVVPHESCGDLHERIEYYQQFEDPRLSELTDEQMLTLAATIARRGNASPLVAIAGRDKLRFIVFMAERLASLQSAKSS